MPVTLEEAKKNTQDKLSPLVIDEFRKNNFLMNNLTFDDCVSPQGGGATMTYGYTRLITQPTAAFRAVNTEYAPQEVTKERHTADLKIFGGSFQVDRIIADMGGITKEVTIQMQQKIKAASALFNDTVINGDSAVDAKAFDGLEKAVAGSSTEDTPSSVIDLSTSDAIDKNYKYFLDALDEFLMGFDGTPGFIGGNTYRCVWALREYPTSTDEQAILRHLGEKDGITLRIYTRHVTPVEEKKIISNAANKNRMSKSNTNDLQQTVLAESNLQDVATIVAQMHRNREPLLHAAVYIELSAHDMDQLKLLQTEVLTELIRSKLNVDRLMLRQ